MKRVGAPVGATIVHQYYPGFIDLPAPSPYLIASDDVSGLVRVMGHVRPLIITDFDNELIRRRLGPNEFQIDLRKTIAKVNYESISAELKGNEGRSGLALAIEKDIAGRVFYNDLFTSLQFHWEVSNVENAAELLPYRLLLKKFIGTYRFVNPDTRVAVSADILAPNPIRVGAYMYSQSELHMTYQERLLRTKPRALRVSTASYGRAARALQDHDGDTDLLQARGQTVAGYLANGFGLSENLMEIERLADVALSEGRTRSAVVEAMSVFEAGLIAARNREPGMPKKANPRNENWQFLMDSVLPKLLDLYQGDKAQWIREGNGVLEIRHCIVHRNHIPSKEEAARVLAFIRHMFSILEVPDDFKGNWRRRSPA